MGKRKSLKICDWWLLVVTVVILASGVQLEIISGGSVLWVWIHVAVGVLFLFLICLHLQLHYRWSNWLKSLWRQKSSNIKWLTAIGILTFITGIIATIDWAQASAHSKIGAVHGKFGFLLIALAVWHIIRRIRFYR